MQISKTALLAGGQTLVMVKLLSGTEEWVTDWAASYPWSTTHLDKTVNSATSLGTSFVQHCLPVHSHFHWKSQTFPSLVSDGLGARAKGIKTSLYDLQIAKSTDDIDEMISTGRPKWGTRDPLSDVNQQSTISQQEAVTHSVQNRPTDPCDYSLLQVDTLQ